jgi:hypothetical protein
MHSQIKHFSLSFSRLQIQEKSKIRTETTPRSLLDANRAALHGWYLAETKTGLSMANR